MKVMCLDLSLMVNLFCFVLVNLAKEMLIFPFHKMYPGLLIFCVILLLIYTFLLLNFPHLTLG